MTRRAIAGCDAELDNPRRDYTMVMTPRMRPRTRSSSALVGAAPGSSGAFSPWCIVGDLRSPHGWQLQTSSLSARRHNPDHLGATATAKGTLSAAWPAGWVNGNGIQYRIGASPSMPAATPDQ